jgi:hypothetical protein
MLIAALGLAACATAEAAGIALRMVLELVP